MKCIPNSTVEHYQTQFCVTVQLICTNAELSQPGPLINLHQLNLTLIVNQFSLSSKVKPLGILK